MLLSKVTYFREYILSVMHSLGIKPMVLLAEAYSCSEWPKALNHNQTLLLEACFHHGIKVILTFNLTILTLFLANL